jgi:(p)ppGpp synthase/HD superfamily hydrolase
MDRQEAVRVATAAVKAADALQLVEQKKVASETTGGPPAYSERLASAFAFAAEQHKLQVRKGTTIPYVTHLMSVASLVGEHGGSEDEMIAALLHDVVEDTLTTRERIDELFGPEIAHVVEGVTKIGAIPFSSSEERQAENFRKMLLAMVDDIRVILVKLADRLHNMRTLGHLPEERRVKIAQETLDIYAPIANRLGMSKVKNELEELSFKVGEEAIQLQRILADVCVDAQRDLGPLLAGVVEGRQRDVDLVANALDVDDQRIWLLVCDAAAKESDHPWAGGRYWRQERPAPRALRAAAGLTCKRAAGRECT